MSTTTTQASTTKTDAKTTARDASKTAKSAKNTAKNASTKARRETRKTEAGVSKHTRRVIEAAQAEVSAVASQPTRPLFFTLGVVDRATAGVRALPSTVGNTVSTVGSTVSTAPARTRGGIVNVFSTAGDLAERAQRGYTEVAKDGEKLVRAVRRQDSTQQAVKYADRAQTRATRSVQDVEKAIEAGTEAVSEAVNKLG